MSAQVTPSGVRRLLESGIEPERVTRLLVATGAWSESGASDIVAMLAVEGDPLSPRAYVDTDGRPEPVGQASAPGRD